jgi:hypothetical protein
VVVEGKGVSKERKEISDVHEAKKAFQEPALWWFALASAIAQVDLYTVT